MRAHGHGDEEELVQEQLLESVGKYPGITNHIAMPFSIFRVKRGGLKAGAIHSQRFVDPEAAHSTQIHYRVVSRDNH